MKFAGKILLVDDEPHVRKYIGLILRSTFHAATISEAGNGRDAVATYEREPHDLVLLDVNMPEQDGIETLRQLRALDPDAVVVMLTSLANRQTVEAALGLGAVNYVRKDTPRTEIAALLSRTVAECFEDESPPA